MVKPDPKIKWTHEKLAEEAKKYNSKKDFKLFSHSAYVTAVRNGVLDEICNHMFKQERFKRS